MADKNYVYYVEGQCEEKLLKIFKDRYASDPTRKSHKTQCYTG